MGVLSFLNSWANQYGMLGSDFLLFGVLALGVVFLAYDSKMGLIYYLIGFSVCFVLFSLAGWETIKALTFLFLTIVLMALSLYGKAQSKVY